MCDFLGKSAKSDLVIGTRDLRGSDSSDRSFLEWVR